MRTNHTITVADVQKRQKAQASDLGTPDSGYLYTRAMKSVETAPSLFAECCVTFFNECRDRYNANKHYNKCLSLMEHASVKSNEKLLNRLNSIMEAEIAPYITNINKFKLDASKHLDLSESSREALSESVKTNIISQRIINNDTKISKRFNINKFIKENAYRPLDENVVSCCEMIDTYDTPGYAKMNIALDELSYIYQRNGIAYDHAKMVTLITEYFLNRLACTSKKDKDSYRKVLLDNCSISDEDLSGVQYFINEDAQVGANKNDMIISTVKINGALDLFDDFKLKEVKTPETFDDFAAKFNNCKPSEIVEALPQVLHWFYNYAIDNLLSIEDITMFIASVMDTILKNNPDRNTAKQLSEVLYTEMTSVSAFLDSNNNDCNDQYHKYSNILYRAQETVLDYMRDIETIAIDKRVSTMRENSEILTLSEFKAFKFDNIITRALKLDHILSDKNNTLAAKIKSKTSKIFSSAKKWLTKGCSVTDKLNEDLSGSITADNNFDHVIAIYKVNDISDLSEVYDAFTNVCKIANSTGEYHDTIHAYCECIDNLIELHVCESTYINLNGEEQDLVNNCFSEAEMFYGGYMLSLNDTLTSISESTSQFGEALDNLSPSFTAKQIVNLIEFSTLMNGTISYNQLNEIASAYYDDNKNDIMGKYRIRSALESWKLEDSPVDVQIEAVSILTEAINTALSEKHLPTINKNSDSNSHAPKIEKVDDKKDDKDKDEDKKDNKDKEDDKEEEKPAKSKINFNTLNYAAMDLKNKAKKLGDKGTKAAHELDVYIEKFVKSVKAIYTNDNRESIIKGSIIPSFHQLMGRIMMIGASSGAGGILGVLSGLGGPAGAIFAAAVTTYATIAISKKTTEKQRRLMLDELDIEIQVCDRELSKADSNNQTKKARAILTRKRKLQREMSRIRYHLGDSSMVATTDAVPDKN